MIHTCTRCGAQEEVTEAEHEAELARAQAAGLLEPGSEFGCLCAGCYKLFVHYLAGRN